MSNDQLSMFENDSGIANKAATKPKAFSISLSRTIPAPSEKIFDRWLIATFVGKWMFGPHLGNEEVIDLQNEVRPGGNFSYRIKRSGKEFIHKGEYLQIDRPKRLCFSWHEITKNTTNQSKITLTLDSQEEKSKLKLSIQMDQRLQHYAEEIKQQWSTRLKALSEQVSK